MNNKTTIDIRFSTLLKIVLMAVVIVFLSSIIDIILVLFVTIILVSGFEPTLAILDKYKIPRWLSVLGLYLVAALILLAIFLVLFPPLVEEISHLASNLPELIGDYSAKTSLDIYSETSRSYIISLSEQFKGLGSGFLDKVGSTVNVFGYLVLILLIGFYLMLKSGSVEDIFFSYIKGKKKEQAVKLYRKVSQKLGKWMRTRMIECFIMGVLTYVLLKVMGVPYALVLAVLAAVLDIIPYIGPIIAGVIIVLIIYLTGETWQLVTAIIGLLAIQQLEASYLEPKLMGKAMGLSPVLIILVIAIGTNLGGILGAIIAVPVAAVVFIVFDQWDEFKDLIFS